MIGVLTHHWAKAGKIDEARTLLDRNGDAQSKAPGFVSRQTLIALANPAKITTLVVWTTNDIYEAWRASPQRTMAMSGADRLWVKPPESERFQLVGLRRLNPEPVGPAHRHRSLRACPPGFVDIVGRPHDQGCDFRRVCECDEGLPAHKTRRFTLSIAIAIQQISCLVNLVHLGPVMRENTDHAAS